MTTKSGTLKPRPYARLMSMLSDQLIKNSTVALTELAKNSYDADASWVKIRIGNPKNFGKKGLGPNEKPFVEIEDDGDGMSFETIRDSWMNPASSNKLTKKLKKKNKTRRGRIIQGEKGIGRYAVFQIGKKVEIFTRERMNQDEGGKEIHLITDLSAYDDDLMFERNTKSSTQPLFFDQIPSKYHVRDNPVSIKPDTVIVEGETKSRKNHGTLIRITELNYGWTLPNVKRIREILDRLQSPFRKTDFAVSILFDDEEVSVYEEFNLNDILDDALLEMAGSVDKDGICKYSLKRGPLKEKREEIDLVGNLREDWLKENRDHFFNDKLKKIHNPNCGPFQFRFYTYDMNKLDINTRRYVRSHRTYIYRDDIRIYPYGDSDNDWIKLDIYRGTQKAGYYISNDSLIGYVNISSEENPGLIDKTSREGLLEQGTAYDDLRLLTLSALNFLLVEFKKAKLKPGKKAKRRKERTRHFYLQTEKVNKEISRLSNHLDKTKDQKGKKLFDGLVKDYNKERKGYDQQIETVEDLAGVGIAVDATSHDLTVVMNRALEGGNKVRDMLHSKNLNLEDIQNRVDTLHDQLTLMKDLLDGIQPLFRSSRRKNEKLRICDIINKVLRYYDVPIKKNKIKVKVDTGETPLIVTSSEGVLLQLFINLIDNSVYWLKTSRTKEPKINVLIDSKEGYVIFADNGPGVSKEDVDYIFEPFFSTKGMHGRGLGLYIARQLTDRYEYDLYYLGKKREKISTGANFRIDFFKQEE